MVAYNLFLPKIQIKEQKKSPKKMKGINIISF